jgi:dTDP-4-dehydrorhamnose reductase
MRILLLGANGQVGHALRETLPALGELVCATRDGRLSDGTPCERADFDQPDALAPLIARIAPDIVVNAAAYTAVDRAEDDREAAYRINAEAPGVLAAACARRGALLVHYSTDYVFDGRGTRPYREDDSAAPLGVYGASKLAGEQAVRAAGGRHMILRTAWVYGLHGHNFLRSILRLARERDELRVVDDQIGTPTSARLVARTTRALLMQEVRRPGTWHLVARGETSWHGLAVAIIEHAHARGMLDRIPKVAPVASSEYPSRAFRPAYSCLDSGLLQREFLTPLPRWQDDLARVFETEHGRRG